MMTKKQMVVFAVILVVAFVAGNMLTDYIKQKKAQRAAQAAAAAAAQAA